jgi:transcriptional regulator with XRE-family HTH domain
MSQYDLGLRMGVSAANVRQLERAEDAGSIQLRSLERAADALGCRLRYVLAPKEPLEQMAHRQAREKAARMVAAQLPASDLSGLDAVQLAQAISEKVEALALELLNHRDLWHPGPSDLTPRRSEPP